MAFWNPTTGVIAVNTGTNPNDGTGDSIRDAFNKIDNNFSNVSAFLSAGAGGSTVDFLNSTITNLNSTIANIATVSATTAYITSTNGTSGNFSSNVVVNNLNANVGLHNAGVTTLTGNTYAGNLALSGNLSVTGKIILNSDLNIHGSVVPTANLTYDLGSSTNFFRNLYVQGLTQVNTVAASSDAGLLLLHANLSPGDVKDVGIVGKYNEAGANAYAFFGYQHSSDNFVYKQTPTNSTSGNSVVYDGVYGNTQFGSQYLSNATVSTSTTTGALIVAGGVGVAGTVNATQIVTPTANITSATIGTVAGSLNVDGAIYSAGTPVLTQALLPYNVFGSAYYSNAQPSTSTTTGTLVIPLGGLGVGGNINAGAVYTTTVAATGAISSASSVTAATGFNGNINSAYAQQPIFTSGLINSITSGGLTYTTGLYGSSGTEFKTQGNVILQQAGTGLWITGNVNAGGYIGSVYGAQTNITQVGTLGTLTVNGNAIIGNIITGTISGTLSGAATTAGTVTGASQSAITSVGTLTGLTVSGNAIVNNTVYAQGVYDTGTRVVSVSSGAGNLVINNGNISLPATGPGAVTAGSSTLVPVIQTDQYGRITGLSNVAIAAASTTITLNGTSGTGTTSGGGSLTFASTNGVTIAVGTSYANISTPQDVRTTASPSFVSITANVTGNLTGNVTGNLTGNVTGTVLTAAQPNITTVGNLTSLTVGGATTHYGNILPGANVSYNLGSSTAWWNTVYGTAVHAQYADLAEIYVPDTIYEPGTVVVFGGDAEITVSGKFADARVAGAVSTNPAYLMNTETVGVAVALRGRIPVKVIGPVHKGDGLVTGTVAGYAASIGAQTIYGQAVFAKSLETNLDEGEKVITAVIL